MAMSSEYGHNDGKGPADCAAHDLKDLMSRVMDQIADADRRNGDLLRQMQERLHHLGQQTRASRPSVPSEYLPGFDRIEDGMSLLAHRIAETYASRGTFAAHPVAPAAGSAVAASEVYAGSVIPAPAPAAMPAPAALLAATAPPPALPVPEPIIRNGHNGHDGYQPQPLRSSNAGVAAPRNGKFAPHVDTFDVVESVAGNPAEPWSPDQVAALSQIYQNRDTLFASQAKQTVTPGAPSQG